MRELSVTCLGVGDGWPCADRRHASFLYRLGKTSVLIDCGDGVDGSFKATGLSYDLIDAIFISHLHADHIGGLFMLMQGFWLERRRKALPIYLPGRAIRPLREMLKAALIFDELLNFRPRFLPLKIRRSMSVRDIKVTAFPTTHLDNLKSKFQRKYPSDFTACCFLLQHGRRRIGHSADLGRPEDLDPLVEKPLDLLVCEAAHFDPEDLFLYLRGRKIKKVVFMHLGRKHWENLARIRRLAAKMLPDIPHTFAKDGQVISV